MSEYCFWILTDKRIVIPDNLHILAVVSAPKIFGETKQTIQETFKRYGQNVNSNYEGKSRQEILLRVINRNHIRIRKNNRKSHQHLSIQLFRLTEERKESISAWAKYVTPADDKYADVIIHQLHDNSKMKIALNLLADGCTADIDPIIISQSELLRIYI